MKYPIIITHVDKEDFRGSLPDFGGLTISSTSIDNILQQVQSAVEQWMFTHKPDDFPLASSPTAVSKSLNKGDFVMLVEIDSSFLSSRKTRVNIYLPEYVLAMIDREAKKMKLSRSEYVIQKIVK